MALVPAMQRHILSTIGSASIGFQGEALQDRTVLESAGDESDQDGLLGLYRKQSVNHSSCFPLLHLIIPPSLLILFVGFGSMYATK